MSSASSLFSQVVQRLMSGDIVCAATNEAAFDYLSDGAQRERVSQYLDQIGLFVQSTYKGRGFFAAYKDLTDASARSAVRDSFKEAINDLEPLVHWLSAFQKINPSGMPLDAGDIVRESELLGAIEHAPSAVEQLGLISRSGLLKNQSSGPRKQLSSVLQNLCKHGYLVESGPSGSVFRATAKWSRLYDILSFINAHEEIDAEADTPEQSSLV